MNVTGKFEALMAVGLGITGKTEAIVERIETAIDDWNGYEPIVVGGFHMDDPLLAVAEIYESKGWITRVYTEPTDSGPERHIQLL